MEVNSQMKKSFRIMGILSDVGFQQIQGGQQIKISNYMFGVKEAGW
jgi:hypothetical protein